MCAATAGNIDMAAASCHRTWNHRQLKMKLVVYIIRNACDAPGILCILKPVASTPGVSPYRFSHCPGVWQCCTAAKMRRQSVAVLNALIVQWDNLSRSHPKSWATQTCVRRHATKMHDPLHSTDGDAAAGASCQMRTAQGPGRPTVEILECAQDPALEVFRDDDVVV